MGVKGDDSEKLRPAGGKVPITPRKTSLPSDTPPFEAEKEAIHRPNEWRESVWSRRNRSLPREPKNPFEQPPAPGEPATGEPAPAAALRPRSFPRELKIPFKHPPALGEPASAESLGHSPSKRRGLIGFFRSRHKGSSRVTNFIVLPIIVILVAVFIIALFKFL